MRVNPLFFEKIIFEKMNMKKFLLPLQNMVRTNLFLDSLAVWNVRGEAALPARLSECRLRRREEQSKFELFSEYTANQDFASQREPPRFARRPICTGFLAKKKCFYQ